MNVAFMEYGKGKRYFHSCFIKSNECRQFVKQGDFKSLIFS